MASHLRRQQLARAARALNAKAWPNLPALILTTDERRIADALLAARALPPGSAIILRHTDAATRTALAIQLAELARELGLLLLIAGDAALAARVNADGLHLTEARAFEAAAWKARHPSWLITAAAHSLSALMRAHIARADAALLAPAFPTRSHAGRPSLGLVRFRLMALQAKLPVYALGGIDATSVKRLQGARLAGIAAVEGLNAGQSE